MSVMLWLLAIGVAIFVGARLPGWLHPQGADLAIVQQAQRFVPVEAFAAGLESPDLVPLHEYALLAAEVYDSDRELTRQITALGWERCPPCEPIEADTAAGLALRVWSKPRPGRPALAAVAFRGTRFEAFEDWTANLRWLTRFIPGREDHYDRVRKITPELIRLIDGALSEPAEVVATGHSLGGGLAQQAGYATNRIQRVYAFDPSPVTGYYDVSKSQREANARGMRIYRIYEHGEVLAYLRLLMKAVHPVANRDPEIVELRFDLTQGSLVGQHSITDLAKELTRVAARVQAPSRQSG